MLNIANNILVRKVITTNYTITTSDYLLACDSSGGSFTLTLPLANTTTNRIFYIVDETGNTSDKPITIATTNNDLINGSSSTELNLNYSSIGLYSDGGTGYHIL